MKVSKAENDSELDHRHLNLSRKLKFKKCIVIMLIRS